MQPANTRQLRASRGDAAEARPWRQPAAKTVRALSARARLRRRGLESSATTECSAVPGSDACRGPLGSAQGRLRLLPRASHRGRTQLTRVCGLSAATVVLSTDTQWEMPAYACNVKTTYAVKWREPDGQTYLGRLAFGARTIDLAGRQRDGPAVGRQFGYEEILSLRIGSRGADRLDDRPALVMERANGRYLVTSAGMGAGIVQEVADRLAGFRAVPRGGVQPLSCP